MICGYAASFALQSLPSWLARGGAAATENQPRRLELCVAGGDPFAPAALLGIPGTHRPGVRHRRRPRGLTRRLQTEKYRECHLRRGRRQTGWMRTQLVRRTACFYLGRPGHAGNTFRADRRRAPHHGRAAAPAAAAAARSGARPRLGSCGFEMRAALVARCRLRRLSRRMLRICGSPTRWAWRPASTRTATIWTRSVHWDSVTSSSAP